MTQNPCAEHVSQFEICKQIYTNGFFSKVKLSPTAKLVLFGLLQHYNPKKTSMFPSQKYLAAALGVSLRSVKYAVAELAHKGLIVYETKHVNHYSFTSVFFGLAGFAPSECKNCINDGAEFAPKQIKEEKKNSEFKNFKNEGKRLFGENYPAESDKYADYLVKTKELIAEKAKIKPKSMYDDKETAVVWLKTLTKAELKFDFIRKQVDKVCAIWNLPFDAAGFAQ